MKDNNIYILNILRKEQIKSTNEIKVTLEKDILYKQINWHYLLNKLNLLAEEGKIEKLKAKAGYFWRLK